MGGATGRTPPIPRSALETRRDSRGERSPWLPLETRPDSPGEPGMSHLPPHTIPLGRPSAPAPSIQYRASNLDWQLVSYMIFYSLLDYLSFKHNLDETPTQKQVVYEWFSTRRPTNAWAQSWSSAALAARSPSPTRTLWEPVHGIFPKQEYWSGLPFPSP